MRATCFATRDCAAGADGKVQPDVYNKEGSDKYKYYYSDAGSVKTGMENAVSHFKTDA